MSLAAKINQVFKTRVKVFAFFIFLNYPLFAAAISTGQHHIITRQKNLGAATADDISNKLANLKAYLYYPISVSRVYKQAGYKLIWVAPVTSKSQVWNAMLMLDCVLQYGLTHADYHANDLLYVTLLKLTKEFNTTSGDDKARFDIMMTDAMLNMMNNLHYGKLNPEFPAAKIDTLAGAFFQATLVLTDALQNFDLVTAVERAQPRSREYLSLQNYMRLLTGQYTGDCYEIQIDTIKRVAINLERLRWANINADVYIHVNIPAYTLKLSQINQDYEFKVVVGKPSNPTPTLQSEVRYFETAPEWKVPKRIFARELLPKAIKDVTYLENNHLAIFDAEGNYVQPSMGNLTRVSQKPNAYYARQSSGCDNSLGAIVFRFTNVYNVYLHDTPEQQLFKLPQRALSHGCIRVEQATILAELLLTQDGSEARITEMKKAVSKYQSKVFNLKKAVAIYVTYLTCEVKNGVLVNYADIYKLDKNLEMALYNDYSRLL